MADHSKRPSAPVAWGVCAVIFVGFVVGGIGVIEGWPVFWVGVGIIVLGVLVGWATKVMEFTEEYEVGSEDAIEPGTKTVHG